MPDLVEWIDAQNLQRGTLKKEDKSKLQVVSLNGRSLSVPSKRFHLRHRDGGEAQAFFASVDARAKEVDLELLHETVGPGQTLSLEELAPVWFSSDAISTVERSVLLRACLDGAPWFKVDTAGRVRSAPIEEVERWMREQESARRLEEETGQLVSVLEAGLDPDPDRSVRIGDHFLGDLMGEGGSWPGLEEAVKRAARNLGFSVQELIRSWLNAHDRLPEPYEVHMNRFHRAFLGKAQRIKEAFTPSINRYPEARAEEELAIITRADALVDTLPESRHAFIFSIDDEGVQEIDDALSAEDLGGDRFRVGVHIAAPGLFITEGTGIHEEAASRCITVYQPDLKWTMLPLQLIDCFSLHEGRKTCAVSTYYTFSKSDFSLLEAEACIEAMAVGRNFTYSGLEAGLEGVFFPELDLLDTDPGRVDTWLEKDPHTFPWSTTADLPEEAARAFALLVPLARGLVVHRVKEGAGLFNRREYRIKAAKSGDVTIEERKRNGLAEGVVTELMILNNGWTAGYLAKRGMPAIYRTQRRVDDYRTRADLTVVPREHEGLGSALYCWSTSPLRRYADLLNQRQLGSLIGGEVRSFDDPSELLIRAKKTEFQSKAADQHQRCMELYWILRYLEQAGEEAHPVDVIHVRGMPHAAFTRLPLRIPLSCEVPEGPARFVPERIDFYGLEVEGRVE